MYEYKSPLRDTQFVMQELLGAQEHYDKLGYTEASTEMVDAILSEAGKFAAQEVAPINRESDEIGCVWNDGKVTTPPGIKNAYKQYVEGGWPTLADPEEFGGQNLPYSLACTIAEYMSAACHSFAMYPGLSEGCKATLMAHGTPEMQQRFLPEMVSGNWTGTMCLTEAHCGSDLGMLRTKAEPNPDGSYSLTGSKIFISAGEHDLSDNIVHLVIARIAGAPAGNKGITLFVVPKINVDENGQLGDPNGVSCGSIEHKMGINGSATCVINFDGAKGYRVGPENKGLACMFTFMNAARLGVANEGVAAAEASYQGALMYAKERLQMRSLTEPKNPDGPADPIIVHPDVRRMLLTQKAIAQGGRAFVGYLAQMVDITHTVKEGELRQEADQNLALLTPIAKAFLTELAVECTSNGVQVYGGHGYIKEWGMEQLMRDTKISCIYEGTTGIQAMDLLGRKVMGDGGQNLTRFLQRMGAYCAKFDASSPQAPLAMQLGNYIKQWGEVSMHVAKLAETNPDEIGAASFDYLMQAGYVVTGFMWLQMAELAQSKLDAGTDEKAFYESKLYTAQFYFEKLLPRADSMITTIKTGSGSLMQLEEAHFC